MHYLIYTYWPWMLLAFILGAAAGWVVYDRKLGWSRLAIGLFAVGLVAAVMKLLPGSLGLWLETALLLFASYLVGGVFGAALKSVRGMMNSRSSLKFAGPATPGTLARPAVGASSVVARPTASVPASVPGSQPAAMDRPVDADNLTLIKGIGPVNKGILNGLGIYKFTQIAGWSIDEAKWIGHKMSFPGRVEREHWIAQARLLASGTDTDFSRGVKSGAIKVDASSDIAVSDAELARLAQDVSTRNASMAAAKAAEASRAAAAARGAEAARIAEATNAAQDARRVQAAAATPAASHPGTRPPALASADAGKGDDLKLIKGIGPKNEGILHSLGIFHFSQIAAWKSDEENWMAHHMAFPGRIQRERWVEQARLLAAGVDTDHSRGVKSGTIRVDAASDAPMSDAEAQAFTGSLPQTAAPVADEGKFAGNRPLGLAEPKGGHADDLKRIRGIGPQNEGRLHGLGIWHFDQVANWTKDQVLWVGGYLAFPGRIDREEWVKQAIELAAGKETDFSRRVDKGLVATSKDDGSKGMRNIEKGGPKV